MDKRFFLTLIVVMAFSLLFWFVLFPVDFPVKKKEKKPAETKSVETPGILGEPFKKEEAPEGGGKEETPAISGDEVKAAPAEKKPLPFPRVEAQEQQDEIIVERENCWFRFTNRGGGLKTIRFKDQFTEAALPDEKKREKEYWYELVSPFHSKGLSFVLRDAAKEGEERLALDDALWTVAERDDGDEKVLIFEHAPGNGLHFTKTFFFPKEGYTWRFLLTVTNKDHALAGKEKFFLLRGPSGVCQEGTGRFVQTLALAANGTSSAGLRLTAKLAGNVTPGEAPQTLSEADLNWVGLKNKYFLFIAKPSALSEGRTIQGVSSIGVGSLRDQTRYEELIEQAARSGQALDPQQEKVAKEEAGQRLYTDLGLQVSIPPKGQHVTWQTHVFSGPKDQKLFQGEFETLNKVTDYDLRQTSCGLAFIIVPASKIMMVVLTGIYAVVGNYGIAIILLTLLVKVLTYPLMRKQQVSMQKYQKQMEKLKPRLEELKKKYKNNRKKYNEEQLKIMKEHGVNPIPLGGCLPMFFTLPIFLALYSLLSSSYELRHAPFLLWINDLSAPDALVTFARTIYIIPGILPLNRINLLPLLMMVAWYLQQKMAPKPADPQAQQTQKMMMFMPFLFGIMLYDFAAGLSLYWLTNSVFGVIEQKFIRKSLRQQNLA